MVRISLSVQSRHPIPTWETWAKPDALTRRWDIYPKEGDSDYTKVNLHNLWPVFTNEQLVSSLRASSYAKPILRAVNIMDIDQLHKDIYAAQRSDKHCKDIITNITNPESPESQSRTPMVIGWPTTFVL